MKILILAFVVLLALFAAASCGMKRKSSRPEEADAPAKTIYELSAESITGEKIPLSRYRGKKMLIVNTASKCGFTPQYKGLQQLHETYGRQVAVLGFPANDFGKQEPGKNQDIASFCEKNYGVTFQMFGKVVVKGKGIHPIFAWLSNKELNGWNGKGPVWNFTKFLIDEQGELIKVFGSSIDPMSGEIVKAVQKEI
ncbi:MAG: glutathione peroxidase [Cytophagales bacterium]|nr:glutathione peroxidase [Cytophagales bacterium]